MKKVGTADNHVDMFPKPVLQSKFQHCLNLLNVFVISYPLGANLGSLGTNLVWLSFGTNMFVWRFWAL